MLAELEQLINEPDFVAQMERVKKDPDHPESKRLMKRIYAVISIIDRKLGWTVLQRKLAITHIYTLCYSISLV